MRQNFPSESFHFQYLVSLNVGRGALQQSLPLETSVTEELLSLCQTDLPAKLSEDPRFLPPSQFISAISSTLHPPFNGLLFLQECHSLTL